MKNYKEELRLLINLCLGLNELTAPNFDAFQSIDQGIELRNAFFELRQRFKSKKEKSDDSIFIFIVNQAVTVWTSGDSKEQEKALSLCTVQLGMALYIIATINKGERIEWENPEISDEIKISSILEEALTAGDLKRLQKSIRFWSTFPPDILPLTRSHSNLLQFHNSNSPLRDIEIIDEDNRAITRILLETENLRKSIHDQYDATNPLEQIRKSDENLKEKLKELDSEFKENRSSFEDDSTLDEYVAGHLDEPEDEISDNNHRRYINKEKIEGYSNNTFNSIHNVSESQNDEDSLWSELGKMIKVGINIHGFIHDGIDLASEDFSSDSVVNYLAKFALNKVLDVPTGGLWSIGCTMFSIAKTLFLQSVGGLDE